MEKKKPKSGKPEVIVQKHKNRLPNILPEIQRELQIAQQKLEGLQNGKLNSEQQQELGEMVTRLRSREGSRGSITSKKPIQKDRDDDSSPLTDPVEEAQQYMRKYNSINSVVDKQN